MYATSATAERAELDMWTVTKHFEKQGRSWCQVRCDCGHIGVRRKDHVESGRTKCCKSCSARNTLKSHPNPHFSEHEHGGVGDLSLTFWRAIRDGAERRGLEFSLTIAQAWELFLSQNGRCALSGAEITLSSKTKNGNPDYDLFTASLDRVDSRRGYYIGNVQWVHKDINRMKGDLPQAEFLQWCKKVSGTCGA